MLYGSLIEDKVILTEKCQYELANYNQLLDAINENEVEIRELIFIKEGILMWNGDELEVFRL